MNMISRGILLCSIFPISELVAEFELFDYSKILHQALVHRPNLGLWPAVLAKAESPDPGCWAQNPAATSRLHHASASARAGSS